MEEIGQPLHQKKNKTSPASSSVLTESFHVNHLLNDVMIRILHEMFEKQQMTSTVSQPRASRKGELLFVKKQNVNQDEPFNHANSNNGKKVSKVGILLSLLSLDRSFSSAQESSESIIVEFVVDIEQFIELLVIVAFQTETSIKSEPVGQIHSAWTSSSRDRC